MTPRKTPSTLRTPQTSLPTLRSLPAGVVHRDDTMSETTHISFPVQLVHDIQSSAAELNKAIKKYARKHNMEPTSVSARYLGMDSKGPVYSIGLRTDYR